LVKALRKPSKPSYDRERPSIKQITNLRPMRTRSICVFSKPPCIVIASSAGRSLPGGAKPRSFMSNCFCKQCSRLLRSHPSTALRLHCPDGSLPGSAGVTMSHLESSEKSPIQIFPFGIRMIDQIDLLLS
jgi:hypothetical protein